MGAAAPAGEEMVREGIAAARLPRCWVVFGTAARADLLTPLFPIMSVIYDDSDTAFSEQDSLYCEDMVGSLAGQLHEFQREGGGGLLDARGVAGHAAGTMEAALRRDGWKSGGLRSLPAAVLL